MTAPRWLALGIAFALSSAAIAQDKAANKLPDEVVKALEKDDDLEVYSLSGDTTDKDGWHGAKVWGKATAKKDESKALATALAKGVTEGEKGSRCFLPRHGVRAAHGGKVYDLLICFECGWVYVYVDKSDKPMVFLISDGPHKAMDKILTDAKVPLDKPAKDK